jgi:putative ISPg6, transposase
MIYFLDIQLLRIIILKKKHLDCFRGSIMTHLREFVSSVLEYCRTSRGNFKHKLEDILMLVILGDAQQVYYQG